jgi:N-acetylmuramoyl-L-alanine amidase
MKRWQKIGAAIAALSAVSAIAVAFAAPRYEVGSSRALPEPVAPRSSQVWPGPDAPLEVLATRFPEGFGVRKIYLDAGHGAPDNTGNRSAYCKDEQDFTLWAAEQLEESLVETGHFEVRVSRRGDQVRGYRERVEEAEAWGAEAFISLHSDVRGKTEDWEPEPGVVCRRSRDAAGFSVLWSDHGESALGTRRMEMARSLATYLGQAGFSAYDGDYEGLYDADRDGAAARAGVFVDRHVPDERIFVLWRPSIPSVIIETHNAVDPDEAARWEEERTMRAFSAALIRGLVEWLSR